jgi:ABC-type transporter Mla subunit MlaD
VKRLLAMTAVLASAGTVLLLGTGASEGGTYRVRAIFDNASFLIEGEDVRIAGVTVGTIESLGVTRDQKAAIVMKIDDPGFRDFRTDATCTIRPQSLIGERFVECLPTQPRAPGAPAPNPLPKIRSGPGEGQRLVDLNHTTTPVDLDLINNIARRPYRERLSIILSELGVTAAGRGRDLNQALRRSNPALQETGKVLKILADQNRVLADLARDSDTILAPLARERRRVAGFIQSANTVGQATAERGDDLERILERFPPFLTELRPTMVRLGALADQATPVLSDLGDVAPDINEVITQLGPFSRAALPALRTLGQAGDIGRPALVAARPTIRDLRRFAATARPVAANLGALLSSFQRTGGVERLMDYIFFQVAAINGFDAFGHYLRAALVLGTCNNYETAFRIECSAKFGTGGASPSAASRNASQERLRAARGESPQTAGEDRSAPAPGPGQEPRSQNGAVGLPPVQLPRGGGQPSGNPATGRNGAGPASSSDPRAAVLDYLLGPQP